MAENQPGSPHRARESRVALVVGLSIAPTVLSSLSVALRLYTRKFILRLVGVDDYVIIAAQALAIGVAVLNIIMAVWGNVGRHIEFATEGELLVAAKSLMAVISVYNAAQILTKISFLIQYRRLFPAHSVQAICKWGIVFLVVWGIVQQIYTPFSCLPLRDIFPTVKTCINHVIPFQLNAVMNMLTDIIILVIPIRPVLQLQVNKRRKAYLLLVFCFGFVACAISAIRLHELRRTDNIGDDSWATAETAYLSTIEISIGILCACVPTLRPLLKKISPALIGSSSQGTSDHRLSTLKSLSTLKGKNTTKSTEGGTSGIYIQKEVEFHSTTELRTNPRDPYSIRDGSSEDISVEYMQPKCIGKTSNRSPSV